MSRPAKVPRRSDPPPAKVVNPSSRGWILAAAGLICAALVLVYANSLNAPFVFDDLEGVVNNASIRDLSKLGDVLWSPANATGAVGRPWVSLSLAINYAISGADVRGYHLTNLLLHMLSALALFGLVRRTLQLPRQADRYASLALAMAFSLALLWGVHPLLTESVTCVIQRTELLGGIFYLFALYAFVRGVSVDSSRRWLVVSVVTCLLGMGAKEILVTAPVVIFFFDRTFVAGSFREALKTRRAYYLALMATWVPLIILVLAAKSRGGLVGFGLGMSPLSYAFKQCEAIVLYLKLSFWPNPLVVDYGAEVAKLDEVWWQAILLMALLAGTVVALVRKPWLGFLGFAFFVILSPSSSFVPLTTQTMAEHRMYLSLAAVVALVVGLGFRQFGRWALAGTAGLALVLGALTIDRNRDFQSPLELWGATAKASPENARARANYGNCLALDGRVPEAADEFRAALRLKPGYADAAYNLGNALTSLNRFSEAADAYQRALAIQPDHAMAHYGLGNCLARLGRVNEAVEQFSRASQLRPRDVNILHALASATVFSGRPEDALPIYAKALTLTPTDAALQGELGGVLAQLRRWDDALVAMAAAVRLAPGDPRWRYTLSRMLFDARHLPEAAASFTEFIQMQPREAAGYNGLGLALLDMERWDEAIANFQTALRLQPQWGEARQNLERAEMLRRLRGSK